MLFDLGNREFISSPPFFTKTILILVLFFVCCFGVATDLSAQQVDIAILNPSTASGVAEGDVSYARTVADGSSVC